VTERLGVWAAIAAGAAAVAYDIPQLLQVAGVLVPPWDGILIFAPSLVLAPCFAVTLAALHARTAPDKSPWSLAALALAIMYATLVSIVYVTQLTVVIPRTIAGDGARYAFLACCGQHEFLTGVDLLGYTLMSLAMLLALPAIEPAGAGRWARLSFLLTGLLAPFIFLQVAWPELIYVAAIWIVSFPLAMLFLARVFASGKAAASPVPSGSAA
jgi:hypothetical protein